MTEVRFHYGVAAPLDYARRLLVKAYQRGARAAVVAEPAALERLDESLWTADALDFVPHLRLAAGKAPAPRCIDTPIWLVERPEDAPPRDVLVNLAAAVPPGFASFERLFEIVGTGEGERDAGRRRLRHYRERGYDVVLHEAR